MKNTRRPNSAGHEVRVTIPGNNQARTARGEGTFVGSRTGSALPLPFRAAILRSEQCELAIHRISNHYSTPRIPKRQCIEETLGVRIGENDCPMLPAIHGLEDL